MEFANSHTRMSSRAGFTLVELSIVLVIIALILSTVLIGSTLIKTMRVRSQVTQIEYYDSATNTFLDKYQCIPGDCYQAAAYGLGPSGNGDSYVVTPSTLTLDGPESTNFWLHLGKAGLIEDNYTGYTAGPVGTNVPGIKSPPLVLNGVAQNIGIPPAQFFSGGGFWVAPHDRYLEYIFPQAKHAWFLTSASSYYAYFGVYKADVLAGMDFKSDDGYPTSGQMRVVNGYYVTSLTLQHTAPTSPGACVNTGVTPPVYNIVDDGGFGWTGLGTLCSPIIRTSF